MSEPLFDGDPAEPLALLRSPVEESSSADGARRLRFEYASRGDRVPGCLLFPADRRGPVPAVLTLLGAPAAGSTEALRSTHARWVHGGVAVATLDLPLCRERASAKFGERVLGIPQNGGPRDAFEAALWIDYVRQAVADLRRAVSALTLLAEVDAERIGFAGIGLGADVGILGCAAEPRVRAAAFAGAGGGGIPPAVDPLLHVARLAPRPCLFVNAAHDAKSPRARAEALHAAVAEPRRIVWLEETGSAFVEAACERVRGFLAEALGVTA